MKSNIIAAAILGVCLIAAGFMIGGRYYFIRFDECVVARGDRWTGDVDRTIVTRTLDCDFKHLAGTR